MKDGTIGIFGHTNTLKALEKRGLVEIVEIGGDSMDIVKVVGVEYEAPLKEAVKLNVKRETEYKGEKQVYNFTHHMDARMTVEEVQNRLNGHGNTVYTVTAIGTAGLDVWTGQ